MHVSFLKLIFKWSFVISILLLVVAGFFILTGHAGASLKVFDLVFISSLLGLIGYANDFRKRKPVKK